MAEHEQPLEPYPLAAPPLSEAQRQALLLACDAIYAPLAEADTERLVEELARDDAHAGAIRAFCRSSFSDIGAATFEDVFRRLLTRDQAATVTKVLDQLPSRLATLALAWRGTPFTELPLEARQQVVHGWLTSRLPPLRQLGGLLKKAAMVAMCGSGGALLGAVGFAPPAFASLPPLHEEREPLASARLRPPPGAGTVELNCDVVVVGSGVGGSVLSAEVCKAGFSVLMLEKAPLRPAASLSTQEPELYTDFYERGGLSYATEDGDLVVVAGAAFGGGSAVNWSCSLDPPHHVRTEWATEYGVSWAAGDGMAGALDAVKAALAVHTQGVEHSPSNAALLRGCQRLGYHAETAPQQGYALGGPEGGLCGAGYKGGERQGMTGSVLSDAAATGRFRFLAEARVERVLVEAGRAVGVVGDLRGRPLRVSARLVVCAAGSLQTPLLLRRSGLNNKHIGRNLRLHPVSMMHGLFAERMQLWEGAPMTTVSRVAENLDGKGYGVKLEVPWAFPMVVGGVIPFRGDAVEYKRLMLQLDRSMLIIALNRDSGAGGSVEEDERGWPRVHYTTSSRDRAHLLQGLAYAAQILVAAGATEIRWGDPELPPYHVTPAGAADPGLQAWLKRLAGLGLQQHKGGLFSAHQMGTCRMAGNPSLGAARPSGETWEVGDLYVCDTSTFPTASGSNPMVTCSAVAHVIAQHVVGRLAGEEVTAQSPSKL